MKIPPGGAVFQYLQIYIFYVIIYGCVVGRVVITSDCKSDVLTGDGGSIPSQRTLAG